MRFASDLGQKDIDESFKSFHNAFVFIFLGELILRIGLRGKGFFMDVVSPGCTVLGMVLYKLYTIIVVKL